MSTPTAQNQAFERRSTRNDQLFRCFIGILVGTTTISLSVAIRFAIIDDRRTMEFVLYGYFMLMLTIFTAAVYRLARRSWFSIIWTCAFLLIMAGCVITIVQASGR